MAPTTYTAFVASIAAMSVTGVTRAYTYTPAQINAADLPVMFPRLPDGQEDSITVQTNGGWPTLRCDLVVLVHPGMLETTAQRFADTLTLMDNLSTALRTNDFAKSRARWRMRAERVLYGEAEWHAVIASIESDG